MMLAEARLMLREVIIAAMVTLVGNNGSGDQVPAPTRPPISKCEAAFRQSDLANVP